MSDPDSPLGRVLAWLKETWDGAPPLLRRHWPWFIAGGVVLGFLVMLAVRAAGPEEKGPVTQGGTEETTTGAAGEAGEHPGATPSPPPPLAPNALADAGPPLSPNVKVTFKTFPARPASVMWGAKRLGFTDRNKPLVVERPRDSGPLDVVIRAQGFIPVHVRAFTFNDATLEVKITPIEKKDTLYGYQQPLADAGAP